MSKQHGKDTVVLVDSKDISQYTNTSSKTFAAMIHDLTTYGNDSQVNAGGLLTNAATIGGWYDTQAGTGPRAVLLPLRGQTVTFIHRPEGTGSGKPQDSFSVVVGQYVETSPVADYVSWTCDLTGSGDADHTAQS